MPGGCGIKTSNMLFFGECFLTGTGPSLGKVQIGLWPSGQVGKLIGTVFATNNSSWHSLQHLWYLKFLLLPGSIGITNSCKLVDTVDICWWFQTSGKLTSWYVKYSIIYKVFATSQVVGNGISEPSTACHEPGSLHPLSPPKNRVHGWRRAGRPGDAAEGGVMGWVDEGGFIVVALMIRLELWGLFRSPKPMKLNEWFTWKKANTETEVSVFSVCFLGSSHTEPRFRWPWMSIGLWIWFGLVFFFTECTMQGGPRLYSYKWSAVITPIKSTKGRING